MKWPQKDAAWSLPPWSMPDGALGHSKRPGGVLCPRQVLEGGAGGQRPNSLGDISDWNRVVVSRRSGDGSVVGRKQSTNPQYQES